MRLSLFFNNIEIRSEKHFHKYDQNHQAKVIDAVRILFSLVMLYRYSIIWISEPLFDHYQLPIIYYLIAYGFLLLGFLSPITSLIISALEVFTPLDVFVKINILIPLMLLLLKAGEMWSLDQLTPWQKYLKRLIPRVSFPKIWIYLVSPFALLCLVAFIKHLNDPMWRTFEVNQIIFSSNSITTLPEVIRQELINSTVGKFLLRAACFIQLFWEGTFFLALFFPKITKFYVWYALCFFLVSAFIINLSMLGHLEILFWILCCYQFAIGNKKKLPV